jgi:hypothetical protein
MLKALKVRLRDVLNEDLLAAQKVIACETVMTM